VKVMPFVLVATIAVFLIAYVPQISLWPPSMMGY